MGSVVVKRGNGNTTYIWFPGIVEGDHLGSTPHQHGIPLKGVNVGPAPGIGAHVISIFPYTKFLIIRHVVHIKGILVPGAGRIVGGGYRDQHAVGRPAQ